MPHDYLLHVFVLIFTDKKMRVIISKITPRNPNSKPLKGRTATKLPKPRMLSNPIAQEGQEGVRTLTKILDEPMLTVENTCLRTRKMLRDKTIPAKIEIRIRNIREILLIEVKLPISKELIS